MTMRDRGEYHEKCDSSNCLLCSRCVTEGGLIPLRYVQRDDLQPVPKPDVLSHLFKKEHRQLPANMGLGPFPGVVGEEATTDLDHVVPQTPHTVTERMETYAAREGDRDRRDKVIAGMDFRSTGGYFATATSCKELCIHKLARGSEGKGKTTTTTIFGWTLALHLAALPSTSMLENSTDAPLSLFVSLTEDYDCVNPEWVHRTAAKLSALAWNNNSNIITVGDHCGELTRVDVETCHILTESDEGSYSPILDLKKNEYFNTSCLLTATKSGSVKFWSEDLRESLLVTDETHTIPVCGVAFSPINPNWIAMAKADSSFCVYDMRNVETPLVSTNVGADGACAHIDFCTNGDLVCSSLHAGVSVWEHSEVNLTRISLRRKPAHFDVHSQTRHFVGLSVNDRDFVATGSEDGKAYIYHEHYPHPVAVCEDLGSPRQDATPCVTAVEWIPQDQCGEDAMSLLVASGSCISRFRVEVPKTATAPCTNTTTT